MRDYGGVCVSLCVVFWGMCVRGVFGRNQRKKEMLHLIFQFKAKVSFSVRLRQNLSMYIQYIMHILLHKQNIRIYFYLSIYIYIYVYSI